MTPLHVREIGEGPRVVLVHGAMLNAARTWSAQEELVERWRLILPDRRGFAPNPPDDPSDFERDADDLVDFARTDCAPGRPLLWRGRGLADGRRRTRHGAIADRG